jgi:hypothetical protein
MAGCFLCLVISGERWFFVLLISVELLTIIVYIFLFIILTSMFPFGDKVISFNPEVFCLFLLSDLRLWSIMVTFSKEYWSAYFRMPTLQCIFEKAYQYLHTWLLFVLVFSNRIRTYSLLNWFEVYVPHWSVVYWMSLGIVFKNILDVYITDTFVKCLMSNQHGELSSETKSLVVNLWVKGPR